jgi:uncharacterized protein YbjT (DUF2867 family)
MITSSDHILVTGATGNVGRELVKLLHRQGHPLRAAVISKQDAQNLPQADVPWAVVDFGEPASFAPAFNGVSRLFLMRPPQISDIDRFIKPVIDYAASNGVRQIVFLSLIGAEKNRIVPHAKVEKLLQAGPTPYTLLRCGFFMQNLSTTHRQDIAEQGDIFVPAGRGKTAFIDVRDIAAVAARVLTEPGHDNRAYPLTGSEALDYDQTAAIFTDVLGRPIRYSSPTPWRFAWRMWRRGNPLSYVGVVSAIYMTTRFGLADGVDPTAATLLGRPPITMRQFVTDHAQVWQ